MFEMKIVKNQQLCSQTAGNIGSSRRKMYYEWNQIFFKTLENLNKKYQLVQNKND